ncbi:MAG: HEAT repeat domain-containing protein [Verrucomicrobia bacterium]|nr:HEAT repeat domain-containing protein [Verrucomicrobiota bacterium]
MNLLPARAEVKAASESSTWPAAALSSAGPPDPPDAQYAPSREIDILHLALEVTLDFRQRSLAGQATLRFKPIAKPLAELRLDAVDLTVTNVTASARLLAWQVTADQVIVTFAEPLPPEREASVTIGYRAQPRQGLYFRTREMGYPAQDEHLWTQGESILARHWFPCFDAPNEKFTSEVTCRVPEGMVVLANGRKVSEEKAGGLVAVRWLQDKPHVNYLISLVAGHFKKIEDRHRDVPLAFWTVPSDFPEAPNSFRDTKDMMAFFERETGVPYPWAKYDQVCVLDFIVGGMENTSQTTLKNDTLHTVATENLRSSQGLVAHELAHQWFGDLVTCKDWSHVWLNEGFATYYEHLYDGHKNGRDALLYRLWLSARSLTGATNDTRAIVMNRFRQPDEQFNHLSYGKGAWVLHMLRHELGDDLYRRCIKTFLERHAYANVVTEDLNRVIEELSGRSFDRFFDQWVYHGGTPVLDVDYQWDASSRLAKLTVRQTQPVSDKVVLFRFPLTVRFKSKSGVEERQILVKDRSEDFSFALKEAPETVRLDPELAVLAKVNFRPPPAMLDAQLADQTDTLGRLLAIEQLQSRADHDAVAKLKDLLGRDRFHGVREEASKALRALHTDEALDALLAGTKQPDARVRRQVVSDLGGFYRETAFTELRRVVNEEKNPDIVAEALAGLDAFARPEVRDVLLKLLRSSSYRNSLADAAIRALRTQDDPAFVEPLLDALQKREQELTTRGFASGLEALAWLARAQPNKDAVRELLLRHTGSLKQQVRVAAITALGTLEDARAVAVLETFAGAAKDTPERKAAEKAIDTIRSARKPSAELGELRKEVLDLQKSNRELRQDLEAFKRKVEAASPVPSRKK